MRLPGAMAISPSSRRSSPVRMRKSVVFPQPLWPRMPTRSPSVMVKESPSRTFLPISKDLTRLFTEMSVISSVPENRVQRSRFSTAHCMTSLAATPARVMPKPPRSTSVTKA